MAVRTILCAIVGHGAAHRVEVAAGHQSSFCTYDEQGRASTFGDNEYGQLGLGDGENKSDINPDFPTDENSTLEQIVAGGKHTLWRFKNGNLYASGWNFYGQLCSHTDHIGPEFSYLRRIATDVVDVAAGYAHTVFLHRNGSVVSCGHNSVGQLGDGTQTSTCSAADCKSNTLLDLSFLSGQGRITGVSAGFDSTFFITDSGDVYSTGQNIAGQLGLPEADAHLPLVKKPRKADISEVMDVAVGEAHTLFLRRGGLVYGAGSNHDKQLGVEEVKFFRVPTKLDFTGNENIHNISAGGDSSAVVNANGDVIVFGRNREGQLGVGEIPDSILPKKLSFPHVGDFAIGQTHTLFTSMGKIYGVGSNVFGELLKKDQGTSWQPFELSIKIGSGGRPVPITTTPVPTTTPGSGGGASGDLIPWLVGAIIAVAVFIVLLVLCCMGGRGDKDETANVQLAQGLQEERQAQP